MALPLGWRVAIGAAMIFPLGFFLGMPFPLGILAIEHQPRGAIAWAWGMNGVFTVAGGLGSMIISLMRGFDFAIGVALVLYAGAMLAYVPLRDMVAKGTRTKEPAAPKAEAVGGYSGLLSRRLER
jgi:hypothetical protein